MKQDKEKLIKYKIYLESEKIRIAKLNLRRLKKELEKERGFSRKYGK